MSYRKPIVNIGEIVKLIILNFLLWLMQRQLLGRGRINPHTTVIPLM